MQPSRARSKNGLFIALGTSAKVRSSACASGDARNAAAAEAKISLFMVFLPYRFVSS